MRAIPPLCRDHFPPGNWFDRLPAKVLQRLTVFGRMFQFDPGEVLIEEGIPNEWLHAIIEGRVDLEYADPVTGRPIRLLISGPGDVIGERGILYPALPIATARAVTEVTTYRLQRPALLATVHVMSEGLPPFRDALQCCIDEVESRREFFADAGSREQLQQLIEESAQAHAREQLGTNGIARS